VSGEMKRIDEGAQNKRVVALVPEKGSFTGFLLAAMRFAGALRGSLSVFLPREFFLERPQKEIFYKSFLERESAGSKVPWEMAACERSWAGTLERLSPGEDVLAVSTGNGFLSVEDFLLETRCPVLAIPENFNREFRRVLYVSVSGRLNDQALGIAATLGKFRRCRLKVLTAGVSSSPSLRMAHARAEYFLNACKVKAECQVSLGRVKEAILKCCESEETDLLILGANETEEWKDHRFRSFAKALAGQIECSVLIVK